jgi:hypothetical protein
VTFFKNWRYFRRPNILYSTWVKFDSIPRSLVSNQICNVHTILEHPKRFLGGPNLLMICHELVDEPRKRVHGLRRIFVEIRVILLS